MGIDFIRRNCSNFQKKLGLAASDLGNTDAFHPAANLCPSNSSSRHSEWRYALGRRNRYGTIYWFQPRGIAWSLTSCSISVIRP